LRQRRVSPHLSPLRLALLTLFLVAVAAFVATGGPDALELSALKARYDALEALYAARPVLTLAVFFAVYVGLATSSLPGGAVLTIAAGSLFGLPLALVVVSFASSLGALLAMLLARYVLRDWVRRRFGPRLRAVDEGIERDGALYLFMVRLVPIIPFFLVNVGMALTRIPAWRYYWVSQLGMLPGSAVFANAGRSLAEIDSPGEVLSPGVLASLVLLALLVFASRKAAEHLRKRRSESAPGR
jgi:uncharacterized membrane protein YdjX (TVP38/TMEM64 family)